MHTYMATHSDILDFYKPHGQNILYTIPKSSKLLATQPIINSYHTLNHSCCLCQSSGVTDHIETASYDHYQ